MIELIANLEERFREKYTFYRMEIHRNPELSYHEERTASLVADVLKGLGTEVHTGVGGHGVVGILKGKGPGRCVGLRADMDALSIQENTGLPWSSENDGVMHACGHDAHTAVLLGAAHVLSEMTDRFDGTIKFVFQPAEENSPTGGAPFMIKDGVLDNPKVDAMLGLHVWPTLKTGIIGLQTGAVSAASDRLGIVVHGKACHASMPDMGIDAVVVGSAVVMALQTILSRSVGASDRAVLTLGTVKGGDRYNIVADKVTYDGTVRTFDPTVRKTMERLIKRTSEGVAQSLGGMAEVNYSHGYPSAMNDPEVTSVAQRAVVEVLGEKGLLSDLPVHPGGEDFAFFAEKVPSAFAWLGCCPEDVDFEDMPPLHNEKFLPDERALPIGVRFMVAGALEMLKGEER
ncbi:M20 metallopeptidase family protein [Dethiosulfovibrio salsuginis]|uniref:Amidohydrolase n=1 Tax=Dethiosulfovibrio salsuginis TaxID=561720 RepID=A0A1X7KJP3_9BACT|nr:M20 family metallopeptidase [Dethiosulfovibrio salsuginis]SMG41622.1 amidohydrolase [Dethiosulfovibrio salsuginis]